MSWTYKKAKGRIEDLIQKAPKIEVQKFYDEYLPLYEDRRAQAASLNQEQTPPLFNLLKGRAIVVDTVQIYVNIVNYDEYKFEDGIETEASHAEALKFLHLHYSACDRLIQNSVAQRVDFHDGRMHAVVIDSSGDGVSRQTLSEAFSFINDLRFITEQANKQLADSNFNAELRVGVDIGQCVAINNGTGLEQEPLFLGSPANHAAKLANGGDAGIFISDRVRTKLNMPEIGMMEKFEFLNELSFQSIVESQYMEGIEIGVAKQRDNINTILNEWRNDIASQNVPDPTNPEFTFHYKEPPLSVMKFSELSPSNSVRMELASIFADLSGFTRYIDDSIEQGKIAEAVLALHVMREEFQNVVQDDFGGRKIRFIGDCIHAVTASGDNRSTNIEKTLVEATACAGGLRDSFDICQSMLDGVSGLGLAIGIEIGSTPISRIGIRGDRSVRVASSVATSTSEKVQQECGHNDTKFGALALSVLPTTIADLIEANGIVHDLRYYDVAIGSDTEKAVELVAPYAQAPAHISSPRAHFEIK